MTELSVIDQLTQIGWPGALVLVACLLGTAWIVVTWIKQGD